MIYRTNVIPAGIQNTLLKQLQESGSYFLSIIHIAEKNSPYLSVDIIRFAIECIENNWLDKDFTVKRPDKILGKLLGTEVTVTSISIEEKATLQSIDHEAIVNYWYNPSTRLHYFNCEDWDALTNSITVRDGKIIGYRVFSW